MTKKIIVRRSSADHLADASYTPLLRRIYSARGVQTSADLDRNLEHLLPYQDLLGIPAALACFTEVLRAGGRVLVVGDFDVDGATSSALAVSALRALGFSAVDYLVPNRFEYGYGLTPEIVQVAKQRDPQLIVTVDNGISSCAGVDAAKQLGMKVIITDHHLAGAALPNADAIVNPNQPGDGFASKSLAGVGVVFYVMLALRSHLRQIGWFAESGHPEPNMGQFLDLVALGTVADVVPLDKNNRILVYQGLQRIRAKQCRVGIQALLNIAGKLHNGLAAADLGFAIAPRLNAAGRLDDMSLGIECLLATNIQTAHEMAQQLDLLNQERRSIENDMQQQAYAELNKLGLDQKAMNNTLGVCLFNPDWHQGVIGILASRIKDRLNRPVIAFALSNEHEMKGSARSISGLHIRDAFDAIAARYPGLISKFGGHALAAGLTLTRANYPDFCRAFDEEVKRHLTADHLQGKIYSDGELTADDFNLGIAETLREAGPWGQAFPEPIFDGQFQILDQRIVGHKHLKMLLTPEHSQQTIDAIAFNVDLDRWPNHRATSIKIAYRLDINEFRGQRSVQLIVEHLE